MQTTSSVEEQEAKSHHRPAKGKRELFEQEANHAPSKKIKLGLHDPQPLQPENIKKTEPDEKHEELIQKVAASKAMTKPTLYFRKTVTVTDTKKDQNRYEICSENMYDALPLLELECMALVRDSVDVKVLDKKGREYKMVFKHIPSTGRYRFIGTGWGQFRDQNSLKPGENLRIYAFDDGEGDSRTFAFINTEK